MCTKIIGSHHIHIPYRHNDVEFPEVFYIKTKVPSCPGSSGLKLCTQLRGLGVQY